MVDVMVEEMRCEQRIHLPVLGATIAVRPIGITSSTSICLSKLASLQDLVTRTITAPHMPSGRDEFGELVQPDTQPSPQ